jgi:hypothetical protein
MPEEAEVVELPEGLRTFAARNQEVVVSRRADSWEIRKPWGDDTVALRIPDAKLEAVEAQLAPLRLPPRFSALWHTDTCDLECIWTPFPQEDEVLSRSFDFDYRGATYNCSFSATSERMLTLASIARPVRPSSPTEHRNLAPFSIYLHTKTEHPEDLPPTRPMSFWVRNVRLQEGELVAMARHLNLYMGYFDRKTPLILIHEDAPEGKPANPARFAMGPYPARIAARDIDNYLLSLWESAALTRDSFRRFLYNYQILEYAAFYYLQENLLEITKRALAAPDRPSRLGDLAREILDAVAEDRMQDEAKIVAVMNKYVDPEAVWAEIEPNREYFANPIQFDGGFSLPALILPSWTSRDFAAMWTPKLPDALRKIRNALVHARESRVAGSIGPTRANLARLLPWIDPLSRISMQVMIYRE